MQAQLVSQRKSDQISDQLLLLQHPPVITVGRGASLSHLKATLEQLQDLNIEFYRCGRGGEVTYHGPGQLIVYPILKLEEGRRDLHRYLRDLEQVMLDTCQDLAVQAQRSEGRTGIWVQERKLASIGVRASSWVTSHGIGINYAPEALDGFAWIVPCGLQGVEMISLTQIMGRTLERNELEDVLCRNFAKIFARRLTYPEKTFP